MTASRIRPESPPAVRQRETTPVFLIRWLRSNANIILQGSVIQGILGLAAATCPWLARANYFPVRIGQSWPLFLRLARSSRPNAQLFVDEACALPGGEGAAATCPLYRTP